MFRKNARGLKAMAVLYLALIFASLLLVHSRYYEPAVSYTLLYLATAVIVTLCVIVVTRPAGHFSEPFTGGMCLLFAAMLGFITFFTGGIYSELYLLFLPLVGVVALHGSWKVGLVALVGTLACYSLALLPGLLDNGAQTAWMVPIVLYHLAVLFLVGVFLLFGALGAGSASRKERERSDEDGYSLVRRAEKQLQARRGVPVALVLVDPGDGVEDLDLLLERVEARIADPVLLGEETVFGFVLSGAGDREVESAARRALAAASSLGATETRAGVAVYPRDARTAGDLFAAAGSALEAAFEIDSPSAIVLAGNASHERRYRAAR